MAYRAPGHSTFSKNRHGRFRDSDLLRQMFEAAVRRCIAAGLVGGERFAVDATLIDADVWRRNMVGPGEWDPATLDPDAAPRAVRKYLAVLDDVAFGAASDAPPKHVGDSASKTSARTGATEAFAMAPSRPFGRFQRRNAARIAPSTGHRAKSDSGGQTENQASRARSIVTATESITGVRVAVIAAKSTPAKFVRVMVIASHPAAAKGEAAAQAMRAHVRIPGEDALTMARNLRL